jgi:hypothetical protein
MFIKMLEHLRKENNLVGDFRGIVVKNDDPDKLGRIKVKVPRIFESSDVEKLPWCYPQANSDLGGRPDLSGFTVPEVNSLVTICFPNTDNVYFPVYKGYFRNSSTQQNDLFDENYPESYGFVDSTVSFYRINKTEQYTEWYHVSNSVIRMDKDGNFTIKHPKSVTHDVGEDFNLKVGKNCNIEVTENFNLQCKNYSSNAMENENVAVGKEYSLGAGANIGFTAVADISGMAANVFLISAGGIAEIAGAGHFIKCINQGILATGNIAHMGVLIAHNQAPPTPVPPVPPVPPNMSNLTSGIADLESKITDLTSKLNDLKSIADCLKSKGSEIKSKLETEATNLKGDA